MDFYMKLDGSKCPFGQKCSQRACLPECANRKIAIYFSNAVCN